MGFLGLLRMPFPIGGDLLGRCLLSGETDPMVLVVGSGGGKRGR